MLQLGGSSRFYSIRTHSHYVNIESEIHLPSKLPFSTFTIAHFQFQHQPILPTALGEHCGFVRTTTASIFIIMCVNFIPALHPVPFGLHLLHY